MKVLIELKDALELMQGLVRQRNGQNKWPLGEIGINLLEELM